MLETAVHVFVHALTAYAAVGTLFAAAFLTRGLARLDPAAQEAPWAFRLIIFPGVAALWPLLLSRWVRGVSPPPAERNPHR
jgi:hypothetical protein